MLDILCVTVTVFFFVVCAYYVRGLDRLWRKP